MRIHNIQIIYISVSQVQTVFKCSHEESENLFSIQLVQVTTPSTQYLKVKI